MYYFLIYRNISTRYSNRNEELKKSTTNNRNENQFLRREILTSLHSYYFHPTAFHLTAFHLHHQPHLLFTSKKLPHRCRCLLLWCNVFHDCTTVLPFVLRLSSIQRLSPLPLSFSSVCKFVVVLVTVLSVSGWWLFFVTLVLHICFISKDFRAQIASSMSDRG